MTTVRSAAECHVPDAVRMGLEFRAQYAPYLRENPDAMAHIARFLLQVPNALLMAFDDDDHPVGMLGLAVIIHPLSGDPYASELFWWVDQPFRHGRTGLTLLEEAEKWATAMGATHIHMAALTTNLKVGSLYLRRGYVVRDQTYEKEL